MYQRTRARALFRSFALLAAFTAATTATAAEFNGSNLGSFPDNDPVGRDVTFAVAGVTGSLADVRISMTLAHTYAGDLEVVLISPGDITRRVIFARPGYGAGATGAGNDLGGTYSFDDNAGPDWWAAVGAAAGVIPSGNFRTSTAGSSATSTHIGGCITPLTFAFDGLSAAQINGTWKLHIADRANADTGAVSAAKLTLISTADQVFNGRGFDGPRLGTCVHAQFDYTGSNRSSYVVVRNTGGGPGGAITWFIRDNDGTTTGFDRSYQVGVASDNFVGGDFDGDGVWDPATWTPGTPGHFHVRLSSRPSTAPLLDVPFGQSGDDLEQCGDYDGDGKTDFAVYRAGAASGDPSFTHILLSSNGTERIIPTGQNGNFAAGGADMTGDGKADVAMQYNAGGGTARFDVHDGVDGSIVDTYIFGTPTDTIITGNHVGNPRADSTVVRGLGGEIVWTSHDSATGTETTPVNLGASATDFPLSSDFDGDGLDDYAVWHPSVTPGASKFLIRPSAPPNTVVEVPFGQNGDYAPANTRSH